MPDTLDLSPWLPLCDPDHVHYSSELLAGRIGRPAGPLPGNGPVICPLANQPPHSERPSRGRRLPPRGARGPNSRAKGRTDRRSPRVDEAHRSWSSPRGTRGAARPRGRRPHGTFLPRHVQPRDTVATQESAPAGGQQDASRPSSKTAVEKGYASQLPCSRRPLVPWSGDTEMIRDDRATRRE